MVIVLSIISGLAWTVVYVEAIRLGFRQRTYAVPIAALGLNLAWEWIYGIQGIRGADPSAAGSVQAVINMVWAVADLGIVYTFFRFGRREFPAFVTPRMFAGFGVLMLLIGFAVQWLFIVEFGSQHAVYYSAFLQNALMSGLFIAMFISRGGARGQSLLLATAKWLGTLAPTIAFGVLTGWNPFVFGIGVICTVLDLTYIWLLRPAGPPAGR